MAERRQRGPLEVGAVLPTGPRGRLLAMGLLLVALATIYALAVVPLLDFYSERAAAAESKRAFLAKLTIVAGELPALRQRVAEIRRAADSKKLSLPGTSDAVASAALQGHIEELAAGGVTIGSTESLPAKTQATFHRIGLQLVLSSPYEGLVKFLGKLETTTPPLVVDNLQVHSFQRRQGAAPVPTLDASLEVYGFRADQPTDAAKR